MTKRESKRRRAQHVDQEDITLIPIEMDRIYLEELLVFIEETREKLP